MCPGTITLLALCSIKWVFFHNGPLSREGSHNSSVLTHFEDPKQGGSLTRTGISLPHPSLLAMGRVAATNKCRGPRSMLGSPLMGIRV